MRLIGLLVTLAVLAYTMTIYLSPSSDEDGEVVTQPAEYIDQTKQTIDAVNEMMKKQQEQLQQN